MIDLDQYLSVLSGEKASDCFCETELDEILLDSTTNIWIRQAYVKGFDCETITKKM